jgi:hypothetical protein
MVPGADDVRDGDWDGPRRAMPITLRSHLSFSLIGRTFSGRGSANERPEEVGTDLLHSAQDTGWRPGRRLPVPAGFLFLEGEPEAVSVLVAICRGSRCWRHRQRVGGMRICDPLQQWLCTHPDPSARSQRLIILDPRMYLHTLFFVRMATCNPPRVAIVSPTTKTQTSNALQLRS